MITWSANNFFLSFFLVFLFGSHFYPSFELIHLVMKLQVVLARSSRVLSTVEIDPLEWLTSLQVCLCFRFIPNSNDM